MRARFFGCSRAVRVYRLAQPNLLLLHPSRAYNPTHTSIALVGPAWTFSAISHSRTQRVSPHGPVGRKEEKVLDCWPLSKLATTLHLSLCPYTPWFCAILLSAPLLLRGTFPEFQGLRAMQPIYVPPTDTAAIRRLQKSDDLLAA